MNPSLTIMEQFKRKSKRFLILENIFLIRRKIIPNEY